MKTKEEFVEMLGAYRWKARQAVWAIVVLVLCLIVFRFEVLRNLHLQGTFINSALVVFIVYILPIISVALANRYINLLPLRLGLICHKCALKPTPKQLTEIEKTQHCPSCGALFYQ